MLVYRYLREEQSFESYAENGPRMVRPNDYNELLERPWFTQKGEPIDMMFLVSVIDMITSDIYDRFPDVFKVLNHKDILFTDHPKIRTMATDGVSIFMSPAWIQALIDKFGNVKGALVIEYVIIHECFHILYDHCTSYNNDLENYHDPLKLNHAQDYEINYAIEKYLFSEDDNGKIVNIFDGITNDAGGLINDDYGRKGLLWEDIYDTMPFVERIDGREKTSQEWKDGFLEGFNKVMEELRKDNLVENYVLR